MGIDLDVLRKRTAINTSKQELIELCLMNALMSGLLKVRWRWTAFAGGISLGSYALGIVLPQWRSQIGWLLIGMMGGLAASLLLPWMRIRRKDLLRRDQ
ncbi:TPA: hypothetical protein L4Q76_001686 [Pseudomonas aeruginosa]|uniref:hypothetical protein n=1 Tax=Pseudomonas aeruginosa TaxID=287 RepID=UPI0004F3E116|nr:hypothetical protein [Pseudomonas aeruginosa]EKT9493108.1 hypothetical protein [Pseudomonas aeruginosa]MBH4028475.1 hypothetical protein [Pseudomonas aeruginosa]MBV5530555.1 hypothetical protein [Pseudomonas aeruginosa]MCS8095400.1 hypothetical protein [Pseudomonas aeruginosa]RTS98497.1 hypothetical protein DY952_10235 [Pseudomonas aeruginosa]